MKIAMISYNAFVQNENNGWKKNGSNEVLLLQNADGKAWGTTQKGGNQELWDKETKAIVDPLWEQLKSVLKTIDKVVMYVGSYGAERIINLAAENGLTPDRAIFVFCSCNQAAKSQAIRQGGFAQSQIIDCECGGHGTMRWIYDRALSKGELPG